MRTLMASDDRPLPGRPRTWWGLLVVVLAMPMASGEASAWDTVHPILSGARAPELDQLPRTPVNSSALKSVGYDEKDRTLEVEFANGAVYQYYNVPVALYRGLLDAPSKGSYFDQNIRNAGFRFQKIR